MGRISENYDSSWQKKFSDWMKNGWDGLDENMAREDTAPHEESQEEQTDLFTLKVREDRERQRDVYSRLHQWSVTTGARRIRAIYVILSLFTCAAIIFFLLQAVDGLDTGVMLCRRSGQIVIDTGDVGRVVGASRQRCRGHQCEK